MTQHNSTTKDLADIVFKKLQGAKVNSQLPSRDVLKALFENLYYASIKTEESDFIKVIVTLIDPENPDPSPPGRIVKDRWNYIYFKESIPFNVKNLVKLSKAADPWSSSLAVYFNNKNELNIWGLIDQAVHYQSFLHYEADSGPEQPGPFQTSVTGIGNLVVIFDYELIATLKQNVLISNYLDVFTRGNVYELLKKHSSGFIEKLRSFTTKNFSEEDLFFGENYFISDWAKILSRLLIRIQNYQHGGAILITNNYNTDLDIRHKIKYDRLFNSVTNHAKQAISNYYYSNIIHNEFMEEDKSVPMGLYLDESVSDFTKKEPEDELKGSIRIVASLGCIDGLVVLNTELKVKGFGAVIQNIKLPKYVYISKSSLISKSKLVPINPNHFGTRHRSMFSYCWNHKGSLGFVVSQDGDIRVVTRIDNKLIMWENIKVQHLFNSRNLKRPKKNKSGT